MITPRNALRLAALGIHAAFRIFLLLVLFLQCYIGTTLWLGNPVHAPAWIVQGLERHLSSDELELSIASISLHPGTRWRVQEVSLRFQEDLEPFLTLSSADIYFSWRSLLPWHSLALPSWITVQDLRLLTPGRPIGAETPIAEMVAGRLRAVDGRLVPEGALLRIGTANVILASEPDWHPYFAVESADEIAGVDDLSLRDRIRAMAAVLQTITPYIDLAEDPVASLRLSGPDEAMRLDLTLSANLIPHPDWGLFEKVRIRVGFSRDSELLTVRASGSRVNLPESIEIGRWTAQARLHWNDLLHHPDTSVRVTMIADQLSGPVFAVHFPVLEISEFQSEGVRFEASADWLGQRISSDGTVDFNHQTASISVSGRVDTAELAGEAWLPSDIPVAFIHSATPPYLNLAIEVAPGWSPQRLEFQGWIENADLHGLPAVHGYASGHLTPTHFEADIFDLDNHAYQLSGSYRQNLRSGDFRFLLDGGFLPEDINPWMTDWWERTWRDFEFRGEPPHINFDIRGNWNEGWNRRAFGAVNFRHLTLRNLQVDRGRTRVRFRPGLFFLEDLVIERPEGSARGALRWIRDPLTNRDRTLHLKVASTIFPEAYGDLVGENIAGLVKRFDFTAPPLIEVSGMLALDQDGDWRDREDLLVRVQSQDDFAFYGILFERMDLEARYQGERILIDPLQVGFAGSFGYGTLRYLPEAHRPIEMDLSLVRANPSKVVAALPFLTDETKQRLTRGDPGGQPGDSQFSLRLKGGIDFPLLDTLTGKGNFALHTPRLADVRLLGLVSRVIEALPLPFRIGSLSFDQLTADFKVTNGIVATDNLRLTSSTTRVEASGFFDLNQLEMDLQATLYPLQEITIPLLGQLTQLLQPFGRVLDFRLHGPFDDPALRFRLDPRNLLEDIDPKDPNLP